MISRRERSIIQRLNYEEQQLTKKVAAIAKTMYNDFNVGVQCIDRARRDPFLAERINSLTKQL